MDNKERKTAPDGFRRVGYTAAGVALGAMTGRVVGWMLLGPVGYRVGQVAGAVAGGALGYQLSSEPAAESKRTADRKPAVVKESEGSSDNVIDAVFG